ncbi:MAG: hypothetical protein M1817_002351 [Caeruleum heppii]|nr:MAG: hypothetical protein M1817_003464 [Caeruleum heppii]KAI9673713.1 MAG: hypothetical protein M1817_002351 [Caeruleum heppii]
MATSSPMAATFPITPPPVSKKNLCIAGIQCICYGLEELPPDRTAVACLWLLHPRLQTQQCMEPIAAAAIRHWYDNAGKAPSDANGPVSLGFMAVSFDQRNHGTRKTSNLANEDWKSGNPTHAQDMFSIYQGTAMDTTLLMDYIDAYAFPEAKHVISDHQVLGVSLGGHAAWQCLIHEPRISTLVSIIGCPDFTRLMRHRAAISGLHVWRSTSPPGRSFLGSTDFPPGLIQAVRKWDPVGHMLGDKELSDDGSFSGPLSPRDPMLIDHALQLVRGKRILNLSGGADKLVPYSCSRPLLSFLKDAAVQLAGATCDPHLQVVDNVFEGVGHRVTKAMVDQAVLFLEKSLLQSPTKKVTSAMGERRGLKM